MLYFIYYAKDVKRLASLWCKLNVFCHITASCLSFNIKTNNGQTTITRSTYINNIKYFTYDESKDTFNIIIPLPRHEHGTVCQPTWRHDRHQIPGKPSIPN